MDSPYRRNLELAEELKHAHPAHRARLAQEWFSALSASQEASQPFTRLRYRVSWADKLAVAWAIVLVLLILFLQQPGGLAHSLKSENIGEWGHLLFLFVVLPWIPLRLLAALFSRD